MRGSNLFEEVTARIVLLDSSKLVLINLVEPELVWSRQMGSKLVLVKLVLSMLVWFKKVRSKLVGSELEEMIFQSSQVHLKLSASSSNYAAK